jgi:hypothetical protein
MNWRTMKKRGMSGIHSMSAEPNTLQHRRKREQQQPQQW